MICVERSSAPWRVRRSTAASCIAQAIQIASSSPLETASVATELRVSEKVLPWILMPQPSFLARRAAAGRLHTGKHIKTFTPLVPATFTLDPGFTILVNRIIYLWYESLVVGEIPTGEGGSGHGSTAL